MSLFNRNKGASAEKDGVPPFGLERVDDFVPASARSPEKQRFGLYDPDLDEDGDDEDLDFLRTLARDVESGRATQKPAELADSGRGSRKMPPMGNPSRETAEAARAAGGNSAELSDGEKLQIFRDHAPEEWRQNVLSKLPVKQVAITELLEDLADTAAAMRQMRKAA